MAGTLSRCGPDAVPPKNHAHSAFHVRTGHPLPARRPPDLRVLMTVDGEGPGSVVIGTCNWRAPATSDGVP